MEVDKMAETNNGLAAPMQLGSIGSEQLEYFSPLLLPDAAQAIERGEPITAIGIAQEDVACGALAGYVDEGCFRVISLYVAPDYRRRGGASLMIRQMEKLLVENDIRSMKMDFTAVVSDNETMFPFLSKMGFLEEDDKGLNIYTFMLDQLASANVWKPAASKSLRIRPFSRLSEDVLRAAQKRGIALETPLPECMLTSPQLERELSHALIREGKVEAYAAFDYSCCGILTLCGLWVGDPDPHILYSLLKTVVERAMELYPPDTRIAVQAVNDQSVRLIQGLVPDAKKVSFTYRHWLHK